MKKVLAILGLCCVCSGMAVAAPKAPHSNTVIKSWHKAMRPVRYYSKSEARTLSQAAIILYGNKSMRVEKVDTVKNKKGMMRYRIEISDKAHHRTKMLMMNPRNGAMHRMMPIIKR